MAKETGPFRPHLDRCDDCVRFGWRRGFATGLTLGIVAVGGLIVAVVAFFVSTMGC